MKLPCNGQAKKGYKYFFFFQFFALALYSPVNIESCYVKVMSSWSAALLKHFLGMLHPLSS